MTRSWMLLIEMMDAGAEWPDAIGRVAVKFGLTEKQVTELTGAYDRHTGAAR